MHLAYYITGHGYGHAVRSVIIANLLPISIDCTFVTSVPRNFFIREMRRPYTLKSNIFDCGCLQSDSVTVDIPYTLECYQQIAEKNRDSIKREVTWCKKNRIDGIVSDITPFAFDIALAADIPSIAVTNFTWYDIYKEYCTVVPSFTSYLDEIKQQYSSAQLLCALEPALSMEYFPNRNPVPLIGRVGINRRKEVMDWYGVHQNKKIALIYIGDFGLSDANWKRLECFDSWEFFGLQNIPGSPKNYHRISIKTVSYINWVASVDCVISKLGYGVVSECIVNGIPLLYFPRKQFAEYPILEQKIRKWGGGVKLSTESFYALDWDFPLRELSKKSVQPYPASGASIAAQIIEKEIAATL